MDRWTLIAAGLDGASTGEILNASNRKLSFPLNSMATGSFRVRLDHPLAEQLLQGDCLIKAYQQTDADPVPVLRMVAEVATAEENAADLSKTLAVTFAEAGFWRLTKRLLGKAAGGVTLGTAVAPVARGAIAAYCLGIVNAERDTGVRAGSQTDTASTFVGPWYFKKVSEAILELSSTLDGYDFSFDPIEPVADGAGIPVARFRTANVIGQQRPEMVFEYGFGKRNIASYKRQVSREGLLTAGYHLPSGYPESADAVVSSVDNAAVSARGLYEDLVSSDLTTASLRALLVQQHVQVRKQARQTITFTPQVDAVKLNRDVTVGDVFTARAKVAGSIRFNALFRLYEAGVELGENGEANYELTVIPNAS